MEAAGDHRASPVHRSSSLSKLEPKEAIGNGGAFSTHSTSFRESQREHERISKLLRSYTLTVGCCWPTPASQVTGDGFPATHLQAAGIACIVNAKYPFLQRRMRVEPITIHHELCSIGLTIRRLPDKANAAGICAPYSVIGGDLFQYVSCRHALHYKCGLSAALQKQHALPNAC